MAVNLSSRLPSFRAALVTVAGFKPAGCINRLPQRVACHQADQTGRRRFSSLVNGAYGRF
jgi:hypothetical protein